MRESLTTESQNLPVVSIIMPVRNEQETIWKSVSAVLAQDYPADHVEILIADGFSEDNTRSIIGEIARLHSRVKLIDNPARLMAAGFNAALSSARGEVILMLGGHAELAANYVSGCVNVLREKRAECVGGVVQTVSRTKTGKAIALAMSSWFGVGGVDFRIGASGQKYVDTVAFGAYSRDIVNRAGILDETFVRNQDDEYNYRIREMGGRILLAPALICRYHSRTTFGALWRQYFQYGYWKVRVMQKHRRQMCFRHFVPMLFVSGLLLSVALALISVPGLWLFCVIAGSYILANTVAAVSTAGKNNLPTLPLIPPAFLVLHLSYGVGFLAGLIRFWRFWSHNGNDIQGDKLVVSDVKPI